MFACCNFGLCDGSQSGEAYLLNCGCPTAGPALVVGASNKKPMANYAPNSTELQYTKEVLCRAGGKALACVRFTNPGPIFCHGVPLGFREVFTTDAQYVTTMFLAPKVVGPQTSGRIR